MDFLQPQTFIFIGRSGSGKGTQAAFLMKWLGERKSDLPILYLETGERFRRFIKEPGYTQELARRVVESGGRLPSFLASWNFASGLIETFSGREHLVFDGSPRTQLEAEVMETAFGFYQRNPVFVIYLDVSMEWATARLRERGRNDDTSEEETRRKAAWFERDVLPIVAWYKENDRYRVLVVNGEQSREAVYRAIIQGCGGFSQ